MVIDGISLAILKIVRIHLLLFFLICSLKANSVQAIDRCAEFFNLNQSVQWLGVLQKMENPIFSSLTSEMRETLRQHPIWQKYFNPSGGKNLEFVFPFPHPTNFNKEVLLQDGEIPRGSKGESIQTHFIARTLKELFPQAVFYNHSSREGIRTIPITVTDYSEMALPNLEALRAKYSDFYPQNYYLMGMPTLKMANGRAIQVPKSELRQVLQLPANKVVINLYNFELSGIKIQDLLAELSNVDFVKFEDIMLIASYRYDTNIHPMSVPDKQKEFNGKAEVHLLSETTSDLVRGPGPFLILNDTVGLMPALHRAADVVLIGGPQNLFEGLNAGTPTLIFTKLQRQSGYNWDQNTFNELLDTARATGAAYTYEALPDLIRQLSLALKEKREPISTSQIKKEGRTWFQIFLDDLERILDSERENIFSR